MLVRPASFLLALVVISRADDVVGSRGRVDGVVSFQDVIDDDNIHELLAHRAQLPGMADSEVMIETIHVA